MKDDLESKVIDVLSEYISNNDYIVDDTELVLDFYYDGEILQVEFYSVFVSCCFKVVSTEGCATEYKVSDYSVEVRFKELVNMDLDNVVYIENFDINNRAEANIINRISFLGE